MWWCHKLFLLFITTICDHLIKCPQLFPHKDPQEAKFRFCLQSSEELNYNYEQLLVLQFVLFVYELCNYDDLPSSRHKGNPTKQTETIHLICGIRLPGRSRMKWKHSLERSTKKITSRSPTVPEGPSTNVLEPTKPNTEQQWAVPKRFVPIFICSRALGHIEKAVGKLSNRKTI